jgi:hypothetical protein
METTPNALLSRLNELEQTVPAGETPWTPLSYDALVTLRFAARGHSASEIAIAHRRPMADVITLMRDAVDMLGARTLREAIAEATRRGLVF